MTTRLPLFGTALLALAGSSAAQAAISIIPTTYTGPNNTGDLVVANGTFTEIYPGGPPSTGGPGVYGVELVGGRAGAAGREIYVGKNTGIPGATNAIQHEITWGTNLRPFTLTWNSSGVSINISGTTYRGPAAPNSAPLTADGNTLKIFVKRNATLNITSIDGTPIAQIANPGGMPFTGTLGGSNNGGGATPANEVYFYSDNMWGGDGFTVTGTLTIQDGGGSARGIYFKHGNFVPPSVPEPASWALLIAGFGLTGAAMRRRRLALA